MGEMATVFDCCGEKLVGVLHTPSETSRTLAMIVVGGPQYRIGSHRQFVSMARELAALNVYAFRFDFRGMGDSQGDPRSFEDVDEDICAAIDHVKGLVDVDKVVLIGLCDGATAAGMYASRDDRITGLVLMNPWVHSEAVSGRARVKYYYGRRLLQRSFWRKLFGGALNWSDSVSSLRRVLSSSRATRVPPHEQFVDRFRGAMTDYQGRVAVMLSEHDITAREFELLVQTDKSWSGLSGRWSWVDLKGADHTLSAKGGTEDATEKIAEWLKSL
jgi:exosortase A-associated hydrolase 1